MTAMICANCGTEIADKALICYRCGTPTTAPRVTPPQRRPRRSPLPILIALILVLAAALGGAQVSQHHTLDIAAYVVAGAAMVGILWAVMLRR